MARYSYDAMLSKPELRGRISILMSDSIMEQDRKLTRRMRRKSEARKKWTARMYFKATGF
jgi:hypothetical protein